MTSSTNAASNHLKEKKTKQKKQLKSTDLIMSDGKNLRY